MVVIQRAGGIVKKRAKTYDKVASIIGKARMELSFFLDPGFYTRVFGTGLGQDRDGTGTGEMGNGRGEGRIEGCALSRREATQNEISWLYVEKLGGRPNHSTMRRFQTELAKENCLIYPAPDRAPTHLSVSAPLVLSNKTIPQSSLL
jgi:hypothetical protein